MHTVEFQKRGLPHVHMLVILDSEHAALDPDAWDTIVSAEIPDPELHPQVGECSHCCPALYMYAIILTIFQCPVQAFATVTKSMIHGPCGRESMNGMRSPCMKGDECKVRYPRDFCEQTTESGVNGGGYPVYMRRAPAENGPAHRQLPDRFRGSDGNFRPLDNRYVRMHA